MIEPSHALASIVRQSGLQEFADAITIAQPRACHTEVHNPARCEDLAADTARQQVLADVAAIGFALFAAALVGRITVPLLGCSGHVCGTTAPGSRSAGPLRSACWEGFSMANAYLLHNLVPFLILIRNAVLLKAWRGRPSKPTLDVRPAPLMTNIERRTIAYMEAVLPWARFRAQVSTGAILAPKKELNRSKATTSFGIIFKDQKAVVRRCNNRPGSILATYIRENDATRVLVLPG